MIEKHFVTYIEEKGSLKLLLCAENVLMGGRKVMSSVNGINLAISWKPTNEKIISGGGRKNCIFVAEKREPFQWKTFLLLLQKVCDDLFRLQREVLPKMRMKKGKKSFKQENILKLTLFCAVSTLFPPLYLEKTPHRWGRKIPTRY